MDKEERKAKNREESALAYKLKKRLGVCTSCSTADARPGLALCFECAERKNRHERRKYKELRADGEARAKRLVYASEQQKKAIRERRAAGLCTRCGKLRPKAGRAMCGVCAEKKRVSQMLLRERKADAQAVPRAQRKERGLCWICGSPKEDGPGALCGGCVSSRSEAAKEAWRNPTPAMEEWRDRIKRENNRLVFGGGL